MSQIQSKQPKANTKVYSTENLEVPRSRKSIVLLFQEVKAISIRGALPRIYIKEHDLKHIEITRQGRFRGKTEFKVEESTLVVEHPEACFHDFFYRMAKNFGCIANSQTITIKLPKGKTIDLDIKDEFKISKVIVENQIIVNLDTQLAKGRLTLINTDVKNLTFNSKHASFIAKTDVILDKKAIDSFVVATKSGNIKVSNYNLENVNAKTDSGDISLKASNVAQDIFTQTVSGQTALVQSSCENLESRSTKGNIFTKEFASKKSAKFVSISSSINVVDSQLLNVNTSNRSGLTSISNSVIGNTTAFSRSGAVEIRSIRVPRCTYKLNLTSDFGDVRIAERGIATNTYKDEKITDLLSKSIDITSKKGDIKVSFKN